MNLLKVEHAVVLSSVSGLLNLSAAQSSVCGHSAARASVNQELAAAFRAASSPFSHPLLEDVTTRHSYPKLECWRLSRKRRRSSLTSPPATSSWPPARPASRPRLCPCPCPLPSPVHPCGPSLHTRRCPPKPNEAGLPLCTVLVSITAVPSPQCHLAAGRQPNHVSHGLCLFLMTPGSSNVRLVLCCISTQPHSAITDAVQTLTGDESLSPMM